MNPSAVMAGYFWLAIILLCAVMSWLERPRIRPLLFQVEDDVIVAASAAAARAFVRREIGEAYFDEANKAGDMEPRELTGAELDRRYFVDPDTGKKDRTFREHLSGYTVTDSSSADWFAVQDY